MVKAMLIAFTFAGATVTAAGASADKVNPSGEAAEAASETGEVINDAWITTKVKSQLAAGAPDATDIDVDTRNNVVTLSGRVDSKAMKERAASIARATEGVKRVQNNLVVGDR
jgi:hyperosmotically inducible protein